MFDGNRKTIFSGIQPSGDFTLGNYLGAIKNWASLQDDFDCIYCVVDMHAITVLQKPADLRRRTLESAAMILAAGVDPTNKNSIMFIQSHVSAHAELCWILNCFSYMGELSRMTQFKDKSAKQGDNIRVGLYDYPVLMVGDILLYQTDLVPVGEDQRQHIELTRDVALRFNQQYSDTFKIPEGYYGKTGSRIMSLADPTKKMSKSDENPKAYILMKDPRDTIISKFKSAVTDSDTQIRYAPDEKPGVSNLLTIYSCVTNKSIAECESEFAGLGYAEFKLGVGEAVADALVPIQTRFNEYVTEKSYVEDILQKGEQQANYLANKTLNKVKKKIGYYSFK